MAAPRYWRFRQERYRLMGQRCPTCGATQVTPRAVCTRCVRTGDTVVQALFDGASAGLSQECTGLDVPARGMKYQASANTRRWSMMQDTHVRQGCPVSVIVPSYNSAPTITTTLRSILAQDVEQPYEVIVADSSTDQTPELVMREFPTVRLYHRNERMQSGTARNLGVSVAQGEILAFTDSDCIVPANWLRRLVEHHRERPAYAAVGGPIVNGNPQGVVSWAGYLAEFNVHLPVGTRPHNVPHIPTSNVSYKRFVFERYAGFPGNEVVKQVDLLFNRTLHERGEQLLFDPGLPVAHHHREALSDYLHHQLQIGRGTVQAMRRLPSIEGSWLVHYPLLGVSLLPAVTLLKFARNSARFVRWAPLKAVRRPAILPLFALGLLWWSVGFARETLSSFSGEGSGSTWQQPSLVEQTNWGEEP
ncbi:MAG: glycosyltransferase [Anaerolineae bacterium]|nr:glycosyltransferase [Anaerolineae bacterium]